ncbi:probable choline kinase 1 isoform X3 [Lotus japonicus]|uniref:probable choline kinase 1 isoform X3 n=1 Tax=Lotus japonicus TaxID=34305 RepID=UPI00258E69DB|nr:probable choline kinase 1 isoform X3 [Lotus japonicus]
MAYVFPLSIYTCAKCQISHNLKKNISVCITKPISNHLALLLSPASLGSYFHTLFVSTFPLFLNPVFLCFISYLPLFSASSVFSPKQSISFCLSSSTHHSLRMAVKTIELLKGSASIEEIIEVLTTVASDLGDDVVDDLSTLQVIPLKGAMTNEVFQVNWPTKNGDDLRKVLVRLYGDGVEIFFDREEEIRTFECVSEHGQGPRLLGRFTCGRVEEFIHARTLLAADLRDPDISALIASKMREFHNLHMPGAKKVQIWERMRKWLGEAKSLCSPKDATFFGLENLDEEINSLEKKLSEGYQEIGFCHNDLQYGNIMMDEETRSLTIIDYEYASYNPIAYDLANHFCEMVADYHSDTPHVLDYSKYPGLEERQRFIRIYLSSQGKKPNNAKVIQLVNAAEKYTLANHLFWGLWGLISSYVNKIDFDYKEYARQRFQQYWLRKPTLLDTQSIQL